MIIAATANANRPQTSHINPHDVLQNYTLIYAPITNGA